MPLEIKPTAKKTEITYEELSELVNAGTFHLFDVREPADVSETGIIKSAINIPRMINSLFHYFKKHYDQSAFSKGGWLCC